MEKFNPSSEKPNNDTAKKTDEEIIASVLAQAPKVPDNSSGAAYSAEKPALKSDENLHPVPTKEEQAEINEEWKHQHGLKPLEH